MRNVVRIRTVRDLHILGLKKIECKVYMPSPPSSTIEPIRLQALLLNFKTRINITIVCNQRLLQSPFHFRVHSHFNLPFSVSF